MTFSPLLVNAAQVGGGLAQEGFRWRNDDGSETTATWNAAQDTGISLPLDTNIRLRLIINAESIDPPPYKYRLEFRKPTDANWAAVAAGSGTVRLAASANITAGGQATTAQLTAPAGKSGADFITGRMWDDENGVDSIDIGSNDYTEFEWCIVASSAGGAANGDVYQFRVTIEAGGSSDAFWANVLLLLGNNQGTNGVDATAGNAVDQSNSARTVTVVGTPTWTNATPPSGLATTIDMDAGTEGLTVPDSADWNFAGDFCIEAYFYTGAAGTGRSVMGLGAANGADDALSFTINPNGFATDITAFIGTTVNGNELFAGGVSGTTLAANTWFYVAIYREGANLRLAYGALGGNTETPIMLNAAGSGTIANAASGAFLGGNGATTGMDSLAGPLRITGGQARYGASAFAIPALPLPTATT